jgi:hypothetical protein
VSSGTILASTIAANADFGNQEINNFCISSPCPWTLSATTLEETCYGDNDGEINVTVSGSTNTFTFDIGNGTQNSGSFDNLSQGSYSVTVADTSCFSLVSVILSGPDSVSGNLTSNNISCNGFSDGSINVNGTGGDGSYNYDFGSGFVSSGSFSGLAVGSHSVNIQDGNGCLGTVSAVITEPSMLSISYNVTDESLGNDGAIDISVTGGMSPYLFVWSGPSGFYTTYQDVYNINSGLYSVTVTDFNNCTTTVSDILVGSSVSMKENTGNIFKIYPNPSKGIFNISFIEKITDDLKVSIFDLTGRMVLQRDLKERNAFNIDISNKESGSYILKIMIGENQYLERIINHK